MSNINKQALRDRAESTIGILENIAGFEPSDIDGDTIELRFETEGGLDTGCDVSIVDQCQKSADVIQLLLGEIDRIDARNADLNSTLERWSPERAMNAEALDAAEKRIAELEARSLDVKWPAYVDGNTLGYGEVNHAIDLCIDSVEKACHAAGIKIKGE